MLSFLSVAADLNLFEKEIGWKGEAGGNIRPMKVTVLHVTAMHLPPAFISPLTNSGPPQFSHLWRAGIAK